MQFMCANCLVNYILSKQNFLQHDQGNFILFNVGYNYGRIVCLGML